MIKNADDIFFQPTHSKLIQSWECCVNEITNNIVYCSIYDLTDPSQNDGVTYIEIPLENFNIEQQSKLRFFTIFILEIFQDIHNEENGHSRIILKENIWTKEEKEENQRKAKIWHDKILKNIKELS